MHTESTVDIQERRQQILKRYRDEIEWYGRVKQSHRRAYQILQVCVIVFSSITPILILMDQVPKSIQALPAALAAMFTAILATFRFHDNYVRFGYTMELLKSELFQFETRSSREYAPAVDDQKALERFIEKMESSIMAEVIDWRQTALQKTEHTEQQTSTERA